MSYNKFNAKVYYYRNQDERIEYQIEYNKKNNEYYKDYQRAYYLLHKEDLREKQRRYREAQRLLKPPKIKKEKPIKVKKQKSEPEEKQEQQEQQDKSIKQFKYDKYYCKKLLQKAQHSLPQPEPFSEFRKTPNGYVLDFN